jgi:molybdopterin-binding protein
MDRYTREEIDEALQVISSVISRCEKAQLKFAEGTSQHTLLKNRINALYISKSLLTDENVMGTYTKKELLEALRPVTSIISKCEKAQLKFAEGTFHNTRFKNMIKAMTISSALITDEISKFN